MGEWKTEGNLRRRTTTLKFRSSWEVSKDKKETSAVAHNATVKGDEKNREGFKGRRLSQAELEDRTKKGLF